MLHYNVSNIEMKQYIFRKGIQYMRYRTGPQIQTGQCCDHSGFQVLNQNNKETGAVYARGKILHATK